MNDALALREAFTQALAPGDRAALASAVERVRELDATMRGAEAAPGGDFASAALELERARAVLAERIDRIRQGHPGLLPRSLSFEAIADLVRDMGCH